ncbi:MAG TPA: hypothetical protein VLX61_06410 [Anaerolineales bacterium]|nr:hypothetical protein [Anaerolineales bacterium]
MLRKVLTSLLILYLAFVLPASALAQSSYSFSVPREVVDVYWNTDGTESVQYTFDFANQPGAHPIDYVDVGMPNSSFDMSTVTADVNGQSVDVSQSDYQGSGSGFSVVLGGSAIQAGASGTVHVDVGTISGVLYPDSNDSTYASADFAPAYFGSQYVVGNTDLSVTFHMPQGVQPNEPRWHSAPDGFPSEPQTGIDSQNRIIYTWESAGANAYTSYTFGASFPKSYVPDSAIVQTSALDALGGLISGLFGASASALPFCCFALFFIVIPILSAIQGQRRKLQYDPPRIGLEGHGIKRGLTAVEAAILLEEPLDKVMTMILFAVVKKGAATVTSRDPLNIQVNEVPADVTLYDYELNFLKAFKLDSPQARRAELQGTMVALVKSVSEKMKGFSRKETQDYYKTITEQAWQQVEAAQTPEVKGQAVDQNLEWTMLDRNYDERSRRVFTGPIFLPIWWGGYDPMYRSAPLQPTAGAPAAMSIPSGGRSTSLPGADFAASVVGGVQTFSSKVIGNLNSFTSGVTTVTNPPPPPSTSSYHGGGGGHCACACACAGCACACAGGGR